MYPTRIVRGTFHQGNRYILGDGAGSQCTAVALMFLLLSILTPVDRWASNDVNQALRIGTQLYRQLIQQHYCAQCSRILTLNGLSSANQKTALYELHNCLLQ